MTILNKIRQYCANPPICLMTETHTYYWQDTGKQFNGPSVTKKLSELFNNNYADIPQQFLEKAKERGTCVHERIESYFQTGIDWGCPHMVNTHEDCFKRFLLLWAHKRGHFEEFYCFSEVPLTDQKIVGTVDLIIVAKQNKKWTCYVIDYKSTNRTKKWKGSDQHKQQVMEYGYLFKHNFGHLPRRELWYLGANPGIEEVKKNAKNN